MLGYILLAIYIFSCLFSAATGTASVAGNALMEGAGAAVQLCVSIAGSLCLWTAVMELAVLRRFLKVSIQTKINNITERKER